MLRAVVHFIELAEQALQRGVAVTAIADLPLLLSMMRMGEEFGEDAIDRLRLLLRRLDHDFATLEGEIEHAG